MNQDKGHILSKKLLSPNVSPVSDKITRLFPCHRFLSYTDQSEGGDVQHFFNCPSIVTSFHNFKGYTLTTPEPCPSISESIHWHVLDFVYFEILTQFGHHFHHFLYWIERVSILGSLIFLLLFFLSEEMITNLRGSRYFKVSLYSLFSTILSKLRIMSCFTLFCLWFFFCWLNTSGSLLLYGIRGRRHVSLNSALPISGDRWSSSPRSFSVFMWKLDELLMFFCDLMMPCPR